MANLEYLSQQALRAEYAREKEMYMAPAWLRKCMTILSGHDVKAPWISGTSSGMKEKNSSEPSTTPVAQYIDLAVKEYYDSIEIPAKDMRRDLTGQLSRAVLLGDMADSDARQFEDLYLTTILAGTTTLGYDGSYIFATDHADDGGTYTTSQSNLVNFDISEAPVANHGTVVTAPSIEELIYGVLDGIQKMQAFRDSMGQYPNKRISSVAVFMSNTMWTQAMGASKMLLEYGGSNVLLEAERKAGLSIEWVPLPELVTLTDDIIIVRTDVRRTLVVGLEEELESGIAMKIYDENSDFFKDTERFKLTVRANRNAKVGDWRQAIHVTFT